MKQPSYRERDYGFGQAMLALRTAIGLTQAGLADYLGVSRRAVGEWEAGSSYPKGEHLKHFISLAFEQQAFHAGREADEIRDLWQSANQKARINESWLTALLVGSNEFDTGNLPSLINELRQARADGQYQQAVALLEATLSQQRATGDRGDITSGGLGRSLLELGIMMREQGNFARAAALYEEARQLHVAIGHREGIAAGLLGLGDVARDQGDIPQMRRYCEESLYIFQAIGVRWGTGYSLNNLALAAYWDGDLTQALGLATDSVILFRSENAEASIAEVLTTLGHILRAQGDLASAYDMLVQALEIAYRTGPHLLLAAALEGMATVTAQLAQAALTVRILGAASIMRLQMGTPIRRPDLPAIEQALAAQSLLGPEAFGVIWAEAGVKPIEQILDSIPGTASFGALLPKTLSLSPPPTPEPPADDAPITAAPSGKPRVDWGDALAVPTFYGRDWEQTLLTEWMLDQRCRLISVIGMGGIGKSSLTVWLMNEIADQFDVVIWRSLRDSPACEALLDDCLQVFAPQTVVPASISLEQRLSLLIDYMRSQRALLVLDNLETLLGDGDSAGRMRPGYEGYGRLLRRVAETEHQSCLLLTSREKLSDLLPLEGNQSPVRTLRLTRLDIDACQQLLAEKGITGTAEEQIHLIESYGGNALALKIVAQTIIELFDGEIAPFMEQGEIIFGGVRDLLNEQFNRLSAVEQSVLLWLAILREPASLDELLAALITPMSRSRLLEAVEALHRRSLIERGQKQASFTVQSVVLEYATAQFIAEASAEIPAGKLSRLINHSLELASTREYVRQTQERLIVAPILATLASIYRQPAEVEKHLLALLAGFKGQTDNTQGYGPANLVALLRLQRGDLRNQDLSQLMLRGVYLQGVEMQDARLSNAMIRDSIFTESFDAMTAVAINRAGDYWAATSRRGEIRLWEVGGNFLRQAWRGHADMIWALAFNADGQTLATGSWDATVKVWKVANGALLWSGRHTSHVNRVAFSPNGLVLASAGNDATVQFWGAASGDPLLTLPHPNPVSVIAWSPDGRLIASGDVEGHIRLWAINGMAPVELVMLLTHSAHVDGLAFAPDGNRLASSDWDGTVKLWEVSSGRLLHTLTGHTDRVARVAWSPDGRIVASSSSDQTILLWDVEQEGYRAVLKGHNEGVYELAFTPDSQALLSSSRDGTLRVWDVASGHCIRVIYGYAASIYDVDWSPDGTQVVSGGTDRLVTIWDVTSAKPIRGLSGHFGVVGTVGWSRNQRWIASSESEHAIRLWDLAAGGSFQELQPLDDSGKYFYSLAWSPDGQRIASGTNQGGVTIWDVAAQSQETVGRGFSVWFPHVVWSPDGTRLAGGGDDGVVYLWNVADGSLERRLMGHHSLIRSLAWSPDGTRLASGASGIADGELFVWDAQQGERLYTFAGHAGVVTAIAWGADDKTLISGGGDGRLHWWDAERGVSLGEREAHQGTVQSLRRSPDGTKLASSGDYGAIILWDLRSGESFQTLRRDRPYERLDITGIRGLTEAQKATLRALGAIDKASSPPAPLSTS